VIVRQIRNCNLACNVTDSFVINTRQAAAIVTGEHYGNLSLHSALASDGKEVEFLTPRQSTEHRTA